MNFQVLWLMYVAHMPSRTCTIALARLVSVCALLASVEARSLSANPYLRERIFNPHMNSTYKKYVAGLALVATITAFAAIAPAFAQSNGQGQNGQGDNGNHYGWMRPNNPHNPGMPGMMGTSTHMMNGR